jgi:hypothetical protein
MVYIPMVNGEDFSGLMLGVFSVQHLRDTILAERIGSGYSMAIFDANEEIYGRHHAGQLRVGQQSLSRLLRHDL